MPTSRSRRRGRLLAPLLVLVVAAALVVGLFVAFQKGVGPLPAAEGCTAKVGGVSVDLSTEQAENATLISAIAVRRGLPARAASIALATAFQESKLRNLDHGDRDSLGLFQQRPSQGWGTASQIKDPTYAINKFYDELQKIQGYQQMRITEAAQKVQHSGFPEAYADHETDARALASALTGFSKAGFSCVVQPRSAPAQRPGQDGLTPRARLVRDDLRSAFGSLPLVGRPSGHGGRAVDVLVRPVTAGNERTGWAVASYLVARASRLQIDHVVFDGRIWSADRSEQGWRTYRPVHRDRVHVDVVAGT